MSYEIGWGFKRVRCGGSYWTGFDFSSNIVNAATFPKYWAEFGIEKLKKKFGPLKLVRLQVETTKIVKELE